MSLNSRKLILIAAASSLSCLSPALAQNQPAQQPAQQPPAAQPRTGPEQSQMQAPKGTPAWSAEKLLDADVRNPQDEEIGEIEDLLIDDQGRVASVVVEIGGFLGLGSKKVELPFKELKLEHEGGGDIRVRSNATTEQLQSAPEYKGKD